MHDCGEMCTGGLFSFLHELAELSAASSAVASFPDYVFVNKFFLKDLGLEIFLISIYLGILPRNVHTDDNQNIQR